MDRKKICLNLFLLLCLSLKSQSNVPSIGVNNKYEIANWNVEWLGKTGNFGPLNDTLQQQNVIDVISQSNIDIWALCEISNKPVFDSMMTKLPDYDYKIANYFPEQKTAILYKKNEFTLLESKLLGTQNPDSFSTYRFPFLVKLLPTNNLGIDTLFLIVVHLKANTGNNTEKLEALNSRKKSAQWLKMYLNKEHSNRNTIVLGDWNDDLDESIFNGNPSPFNVLLDNQFDFDFISKKLTYNNISTTAGFTNPIDHQLVSKKLLTHVQFNSPEVWRLDQFITNYSNTTSDHYPVYSYFYQNATSTLNLKYKNNYFVYPVPNHGELYFSDNVINKFVEYTISNHVGTTVKKESSNYDGTSIQLSDLKSGFYTIEFKIDNKYYNQFFVLEN